MASATRGCTNNGETHTLSRRTMDLAMLASGGAPVSLSVFLVELLTIMANWSNGSQPNRSVSLNGRGPAESRIIVDAETFGAAHIRLSELDPYGRVQSIVNKAGAHLGKTMKVADSILGTSRMFDLFDIIADERGAGEHISVDDRGWVLVDGIKMTRKGGHHLFTTEHGPAMAYNTLGLAYAELETGMAPSGTNDRPMIKHPNATASADNLRCSDGSRFADTYSAELETMSGQFTEAMPKTLRAIYPNLTAALESFDADQWEERRQATSFLRVHEV